MKNYNVKILRDNDPRDCYDCGKPAVVIYISSDEIEGYVDEIPLCDMCANDREEAERD